MSESRTLLQKDGRRDDVVELALVEIAEALQKIAERLNRIITVEVAR